MASEALFLVEFRVSPTVCPPSLGSRYDFCPPNQPVNYLIVVLSRSDCAVPYGWRQDHYCQRHKLRSDWCSDDWRQRVCVLACSVLSLRRGVHPPAWRWCTLLRRSHRLRLEITYRRSVSQTVTVRVTPTDSDPNPVPLLLTYSAPNITDFTPKTGSTSGGYNMTITVCDK